MRIEPMDYSALEAEVSGAMETADHIVLATSAAGEVTARSMSPVNVGLDVYMQTDSRFTKIAQMEQNARVALCLGNIQIEGTAEILGHPMDAGNEGFRVLFSEKHRGSFERYSTAKEELVFVVHPVQITLWKYIAGNPCRDRMKIAEHTTYREYYE